MGRFRQRGCFPFYYIIGISMLLFWRMVLAHLLGDFTLQSDLVAKWKRESWFGMPLHCLTHLITLLALTWPFLGQRWVYGMKGWQICIAITLIHYIVDITRVFLIRRFNVRDGLVMFAIDQILHYYVLFLAAGHIKIPEGISLLPVKWFIIFSLFAFTAHAVTVTGYYMDRELDHNKKYPPAGARYFLMAERIVLMLFFFLPGVFWMPFAFLWILQIYLMKTRRVVDVSSISLALNILVPVVAGSAGRIVFYGHF